jgi:hypothetical protein
MGACLHAADLSCAELSGAHLADADLRLARLESNVRLQGADLTGARLAGATISPQADLDGVTWWPPDARRWVARVLHAGVPPMLVEEAEAGIAGSRLRVCERLYRQIKRAYQNAGQYDEAGVFFVREMECKRKQLPRWRGLWYNLLHFVSDYFENPRRVAIIGAAVILLFTWLHAWQGVHLAPLPDSGAEGLAVAGPGLTWPTLEGLEPFGRARYFSAITFTATGYGDYVPSERLGQFFAAAESLIGVFLMAMFLVCLARKFGRA